MRVALFLTLILCLSACDKNALMTGIQSLEKNGNAGNGNTGTGDGGGDETGGTTPMADGTAVPSGILLLAKTGTSLTLSGGGELDAGKATITVNSSDDNAVNLSGGAHITAGEVDAVGGIHLSGNAHIDAKEVTPAKAGQDPLAKLAPPDPTKLDAVSAATLDVTDKRTLKPGVYAGGIRIEAGAEVTLAAGIYYLKGGGLKVSGDASLDGDGVMIFHSPAGGGDDIDLSGSGSLQLSAPKDGVYQGVVVFQDRNAPGKIRLSGGSSTKVTGAVYAPAGQLELSGGAADNAMGSLHIAQTLQISGGGTVHLGK